MMSVEFTGDIGQWLYFLRLRSGVKVHPEARQTVHTLDRQIARHIFISTST